MLTVGQTRCYEPAGFQAGVPGRTITATATAIRPYEGIGQHGDRQARRGSPRRWPVVVLPAGGLGLASPTPPGHHRGFLVLNTCREKLGSDPIVSLPLSSCR